MSGPLDYRVDPAKLVFRAPAYDGEIGQPPRQCLARKAAPALKGMSVSGWLFWKFLRLFDAPRDRVEEDRAYLYAEQCNCFDGHWAYDDQRQHVNGYGDRWPVTEADTSRLNP